MIIKLNLKDTEQGICKGKIMKKLMISFVTCFILFSCKEESVAPKVTNTSLSINAKFSIIHKDCIDTACTTFYIRYIESCDSGTAICTYIKCDEDLSSDDDICIFYMNENHDTLQYLKTYILRCVPNKKKFYSPEILSYSNGYLYAFAYIKRNDETIWTGRDTIFIAKK